MGKEVSMLCHRVVVLKKNVLIFTVQLYVQERSPKPVITSDHIAGVLRWRTGQGLADEGDWARCAAWELVPAVEEDKPGWKCRSEAEMASEQPQALGFLERDQSEGRSPQILMRPHILCLWALPSCPSQVLPCPLSKGSVWDSDSHISTRYPVLSTLQLQALCLHTYCPHLTQSYAIRFSKFSKKYMYF